MGTEIANPLADIIRRAATMPADGPASKLKLRMEEAGDDIFALVDVSGSMKDLIGSIGLSKYDQLVIALKDTLIGIPKMRIVAFGSYVREVKKVSEMPPPCDGGTNLAEGLLWLKPHKPGRTIIITDGLATSGEGTSEAAAASITGMIQGIYCGHDGNPAAAWLHGLCRSVGGRSVSWDGRGELGDTMRQLLIEGPNVPRP